MIVNNFISDLGEHYDTHINTMPQIIKNGILLGGFEELIDFIRPSIDFEKLKEVAKVLTINLNQYYRS